MKARRSVPITALALALALLTGCASGESSTGEAAGAKGGGPELRLDYAYYNPLSLVIREQKLLESALPGTKITWVWSAGSNKANENLRAKAIDFGSTAGSAALQSRSNGTPIKSVMVTKGGEWTAIVVAKGSAITSPAQLKGKRIAVTKGTDPYFFLLQTLRTAGLSARDVKITNLQHADGKTALERGDVDAWAGLDPYMAQTEREAGSKLIYRNVAFNSYNLLNAREDVITGKPELVEAVVNAYQRARAWAKRHPGELTALLARDSKVTPEVAAIQLKRSTFELDPVPGAPQRKVLDGILPILVQDGDVKSEEAARTALESLFEPGAARRVAAP